MRKIIMLVAAVAMLATMSHGNAQEASGNTYLDALRTCGAEWKARSDKSVKGAAAWQEFRKTCTNEKGWVSKKSGKKGGKEA